MAGQGSATVSAALEPEDRSPMKIATAHPRLLVLALLAATILATNDGDRVARLMAGARAQQPAPPATSSPPATLPKTEAIVPPMARQPPPPGKTSVPIVAGPKARKGAKPPSARKKAPKGKPKARTARPGQGLKADPKLKCQIGFHYDVKRLRCVKGATPPPKAAGRRPGPRG